MLKEIETEETIVFFVTFLSLVAFQLEGGGGGGGPPRYAYVQRYIEKTRSKIKLTEKQQSYLAVLAQANMLTVNQVPCEDTFSRL